MGALLLGYEKKARENRGKHGVSFEEAATCFEDSKGVYLRNEAPSYEDRLILIGASASRRVLFVVHAEVERDAIAPSAPGRRAKRKSGSTKDWTDEPIIMKVWKRVPGNPFADYDPAEGIALWSLWEMPSSVIGAVVRRGRPRGEPTMVRSVRLPVALWTRLEKEAAASKTTVNDLIRRRVV